MHAFVDPGTDLHVMQSSIRLFIFSYVLQPRTMEMLFKKETLIN